MKKVILILLLLCFSISVFAQQGRKAKYGPNPPVNLTSLTKDAVPYDTLNTGKVVYLRYTTDKTGKKTPYYFTIETKFDYEKGEPVTYRRRLYIQN